MRKRTLILAAVFGLIADSSVFAADPTPSPSPVNPTPSPSPVKGAATETASPSRSPAKTRRRARVEARRTGRQERREGRQEARTTRREARTGASPSPGVAILAVAPALRIDSEKQVRGEIPHQHDKLGELCRA
jgi:uncharacterized membrane protein